MTFNNTSGYTIASSGSGHLVTNTYTGTPAINVTAGNHIISAPMILSKATTTTVASGADLSISGEVANTTGLTKAGAGTMTVSGVIKGSAGTVGVTGGQLTLTGSNLYTGGTSISAGATLVANNVGTTSATGTGAITNNGTFNVLGRVTGATTTPAGGATNVSGTATGAQTVSGGVVDVGTTGVLTGTSTMSLGGKLQNQGFQSTVQIAGVAVQSTGHFAPGGIGTAGSIRSSTGGTLNFSAGGIFDIDIGTAGFDQFQYGNTTANTIGLTIAAGAIMKVTDIGGMTAGVYPIMSLGATPNAATIALFNNFVFTGSAPGFTYGLSVAGTTVNLSVTGPGSGSGLDGGGAVPEPTTIGLIGIALAAFASRRRSRKA
jgi:autotransporter-associated beta strand protein